MIIQRHKTGLHYYIMMGVCVMLLLTGCGIYSFKDSNIPASIKTVKIGFIDNKARYINPQLGQKFTDKIQQKIVSGTKLTRTNEDNADYVINGTITNYDGTQTVGVSSQQASVNRLTVTLHMVLRKNQTNETEEFDGQFFFSTG